MQVYENSIGIIPRLDKKTIQSGLTCTVWVCLPQNAPRHLGPPPGRYFGKQVTTKKTLLPHGYYECANTPGLWKHSTCLITFSLVVNNFRVKYVGKEHADHLIQCIKKDYELTKDWTGDFYCSIQLIWDYNAQTLDISMPGYIKKVLQKYNIASPQNCNTVLIPCPQNSTAQRHKNLSPSTFPSSCCQRKSKKYNTSLAASYTMPTPSTSQCWWPSALLQSSKLK